MPLVWSLPPDTRAVGTPNPAGDMNAVVDALNHSVYQRVFFIDRYGADPTGVALSDAAWTACYSDALAAVQTHAGVVIEFGCGWYQFTTGVINIADERIGLRGQGRYATTLYTTTTSGILVQVTGNQGGSTAVASAPVNQFSLFGWMAGANTSGLLYGDRANGFLVDVTTTGFGNRGFWFFDTVGLSEGSFMVCNADQNGFNYDFGQSGAGGIGSFDYSHFYFHSVTTNAVTAPAVCLRLTQNQHIYGGVLHLAGNCSATTGNTTTAIQVGNGATDSSRIQATNLNVALEADTGSGTVTDIVVNSSAGTGINHCNGIMTFLNVGGSWTAGSVTGGAITTAGYLNGPLFSSHGTLTALGTGGALSTYSG